MHSVDVAELFVSAWSLSYSGRTIGFQVDDDILGHDILCPVRLCPEWPHCFTHAYIRDWLPHTVSLEGGLNLFCLCIEHSTNYGILPYTWRRHRLMSKLTDELVQKTCSAKVLMVAGSRLV